MQLAILRYLRPEPRLRFGVMAGRTRAASACMDLSDGLADALRQVAAASGAGAADRRRRRARGPGRGAAVQRHGGRPAARGARRRRRLRAALRRAAPRRAADSRPRRARPGCAVTRIGVLTPEAGVVVGSDDRPLPHGVRAFGSRRRRRDVVCPTIRREGQTRAADRRTLSRLPDTPERTALAFGLGVFLGFSPFLGLQTLAWHRHCLSTRLSRVAVILGTWVNLPWVVPVYYVLATELGARLLGVEPPSRLGADLRDMVARAGFGSSALGELLTIFRPMLWPFVRGNARWQRRCPGRSRVPRHALAAARVASADPQTAPPAES